MMVMEYIKSDLCRYVGIDNICLKSFIKTYIGNTGFKFSFWFRLCKSKSKVVRIIANIQRRRFKNKYFLDIPADTNIGYGLYIAHGQSIVINPAAVIGNNVILSQFTTIGSNHSKGAIIGDNVYIGPGVCIVEDVIVGDEVKIGAGAVVTKDIPKNSVSAGVPSRVINVCEYNDYSINRWNINK